MEARTKELRYEFRDGASVFVDLYESDKGRLAIISREVSNPFNKGPEPQIYRETITKQICREFGCNSENYRHLEQDGQHWQDVPVELRENGQIKIRDGVRVTQVSERSVQRAIAEHKGQSVGQELVDSPGWESHLQRPNQLSHDD